MHHLVGLTLLCYLYISALQVVAAAHAAQLTAFIASLPAGFDTKVREGEFGLCFVRHAT